MLTQCFFGTSGYETDLILSNLTPHGSYCAANYQLIPLELALHWCLYEPNSSNTNGGVVFSQFGVFLNSPKTHCWPCWPKRGEDGGFIKRAGSHGEWIIIKNDDKTLQIPMFYALGGTETLVKRRFLIMILRYTRSADSQCWLAVLTRSADWGTCMATRRQSPPASYGRLQ